MEQSALNGQQEHNRGKKKDTRTMPAHTPMSGMGLWGITHELTSGTQRM